ncbi:MAG: hypothetical protein WC718_04325 [Phycisphaerales bacterium]|jgi:hypothetical protein
MAWFERLPTRLQAWLTIAAIMLGALGAAYGLGAATGGTVEDLRTLPPRMDSAEVRIDTLRATTAYLMRVDSMRPGVWGSVEKMEADMAETRCYVKAFALNRNPLTDCAPMLNERGPR